MTALFRPYIYQNKLVKNVGITLVLIGSLLLIKTPFQFFGMYMPFMHEPRIYGWLMAILGALELILIVIAALKIRSLVDVSEEEMFNIGSILLILWSLISIIIWSIIYAIVVQSWLPSYTIELVLTISIEVMQYYFYTVSIFSLLLLSGVLWIIGFVVRIILAIAFWRFGEYNKSDLMQVGALIFVFIDSIGFIILGFALYLLASETERALENNALLVAIKDYLAKSVPEGATIDIREVAKRYGIAPYALASLIREWIASDELKGLLSSNLYIQHRSSP